MKQTKAMMKRNLNGCKIFAKTTPGNTSSIDVKPWCRLGDIEIPKQSKWSFIFNHIRSWYWFWRTSSIEKITSILLVLKTLEILHIFRKQIKVIAWRKPLIVWSVFKSTQADNKKLYSCGNCIKLIVIPLPDFLLPPIHLTNGPRTTHR